MPYLSTILSWFPCAYCPQCGIHCDLQTASSLPYLQEMSQQPQRTTAELSQLLSLLPSSPYRWKQPQFMTVFLFLPIQEHLLFLWPCYDSTLAHLSCQHRRLYLSPFSWLSSDKRNLSEQGLVCAHGLDERNPLWWGKYGRGSCLVHTANHEAEKEKGQCLVLSWLSHPSPPFQIKSRLLIHWMVPPTF